MCRFRAGKGRRVEPLIPTIRLVLAFSVPFALSVAAVFIPGLMWIVIGVDLLIVFIALIDLLLNRAKLSATRDVSRIQTVGRKFSVHVSLSNLGRRRLQVRLTDDAPGESGGLPVSADLPRRSMIEVAYDAQVDKRGVHEFGPVTVRYRSLLGFWERQKTLPVKTTLQVYPNFRQIRHYGMAARDAERRLPVRVRRRAGGENDFERLRPYVPGDPYRHIDWKATARRREFTTRQFQQESNQNVIFLVDSGRLMTGKCGDLTAFDHALNAALMMGQMALRHGDRVGMLVFDAKVRVWLPPKGGARSGGRLIRGTYDVFPEYVEPDYSLAFRHLSQRVRQRSLVVLLTSVIDEVNAGLATSLVQAMSTRHLPLCVWIRDGEVDELLNHKAEVALDQYIRCAAAELTGWRELALMALHRRGAMVVDCKPEDLTARLLGRYLEIKARRLL